MRSTRVIAPLQAEEAEELSALAAHIWRSHYPPIIGEAQTEYMLAQRYSVDAIRRELAAGDVSWDVLRENGSMRAFVSFFRADAPDALKLDKLYVHPDHQRCGLGAALVSHVCDRARQIGCRRVVLAVNKRNSTAIRAYRHYGFEVTQAIVKDIGGGFVMDDYIMERGVSGA